MKHKQAVPIPDNLNSLSLEETRRLLHKLRAYQSRLERENEDLRTARERAEQALRESEEKSRALLGALPDLIFRLSRDGTHLDFYAPRLSDLFVKPDDFLGKQVQEVLPADAANAYLGAIQKTLESKEMQLFEYSLEFPEKGTQYFETRVVPIVEGEVLTIVRNITARKRAEATLRRSQLLLQAMERVTKVGGWEYDIATKRITWTDGVYHLYGVSPETHDPNQLQQNIAFYAPKDQAAINTAFQRLIERGEAYDLELRFVDARGQRLWARTIGQAEVQQGRVVRAYGNFMDITAHKQAEEALKAANARLEALWGIRSSVTTDTKKLSDHILVSLTAMTGSAYSFYGFIDEDESVMTIYSWSGEAMKDCSIVDKPAHFPINEAGVWAEAIRHRKPFILNDCAAAHPAKKGFPKDHVPLTNMLIAPFLLRGKIISVAAVANRPTPYDKDDVTQITTFLNHVQAIVDNKQAEEALRASEGEYRQLAQENARLLQEVNHRVGNNLAMLLALVSLAMANAATPETREALQDLRGRVQSMASVHRLLSGAQWSSLDLRTLVERVIQGVLDTVTIRDQIQCQVRSHDKPVSVTAKQAFRLALIFNELTTNSLKYAFQARSSGDIQVEIATEGLWVRLLFRDDGPGWPADVLAGQRQSIGLNLMRAIIEREMGGELTLRNDGGAVFICRFALE